MSFQFSLRHLLIAVACIAVACTALLNAGPWWVRGMWLATVGLLFVAVIRTIYCRGERRAYWLGFAIAGWLCIVSSNDWFDALRIVRQVPQQIMVLLYSRLPDSLRMPYIEEQTGKPVDGSTPPTVPQTANYGSRDPQVSRALLWLAQQQQPTFAANPRHVPADQFLSIGEALWTLLMALLGGIAARWMYRSEQARAAAAN